MKGNHFGKVDRPTGPTRRDRDGGGRTDIPVLKGLLLFGKVFWIYRVLSCWVWVGAGGGLREFFRSWKARERKQREGKAMVARMKRGKR